jgi:hypothetical protein
MPIAFALSLLVQVTCAYHVVRTGRDKYWLFVILFFSLIGCAIYFFVEMLPDLMGGRTGRNLAAGAKKIIDPDRAWREAMTQVEISPTAHNKRVLADACVARGNFADAIALYTETLTGHDAYEPDLLRSRAGARLLAGDHAGALTDLDTLRAHNPDYQSEAAHLIYARALDSSGRDEEALTEYAALVAYSTGEEARCRYALLLKRMGRQAQAQSVFAEILRRARHAPRHYRRIEREWIDAATANLTS